MPGGSGTSGNDHAQHRQTSRTTLRSGAPRVLQAAVTVLACRLPCARSRSRRCDPEIRASGTAPSFLKTKPSGKDVLHRR
eukprot:5228071-Alexandrium_andersonii.AAC.1